MMPSSPPTRGWNGLPGSPARSQYSIHLSALGPESSDGDDATPLPQQRIDRVLSDEIGGPSDFTLNLEAYMRGEPVKKKQKPKPAMKDVGVGEDAPTKSPARSEYSIHLSAFGDEGSDGDEATPLPQQHIDSVLSDEIGGPSDFTLNLVELMRGDTLKKKQKPKPANYLQPTVDDYHSELSPARLPSAQSRPAAELDRAGFEERRRANETENELQLLRTEFESQRTALNEAILERDAAKEARLKERRKASETQNELARLRAEFESQQTALKEAILERDAAKEAGSKKRRSTIETKNELRQLRSEFESQQTALNDAILERDATKEAESKKRRSTSETENKLQNKLQQLRSEFESQQTALNEAILERDAAKDGLEEPASSHQQQSNQAALNDAILERDAAQDSLQTTQSDLEAARAELANVKSELSDMRTVNSTLDTRISDSIRKREAYWRRKMEDMKNERKLMENEKKLMSKALMRMWGREEMGIKEPQQYAYKFREKVSVA